jgi:trk system potassium uptake protein TrkA
VHVVIVGCGRVGSELAATLEDQGHTLAVIDKNARAFRRLHTGFAGTTVNGLGFDRETLAAAKIDEAGAFAAVTNGDNSTFCVLGSHARTTASTTSSHASTTPGVP